MRKQTEFNLNGGSWGGLRKNSGRKRKSSAGAAHTAREIVSFDTPLHINLKYSVHLRNSKGLRAFEVSVRNARKFMNVIHYSIESNHLHLIVEAENNELLEKGMRSFTSTFCILIGEGAVQIERYHLHVLKTPVEVKNAFRYVLLNHIHHTNSKVMKADLFSSLHQLDLSEIAKRFGLIVQMTKSKKSIDLDQPSSWLARQGLKPT